MTRGYLPVIDALPFQHSFVDKTQAYIAFAISPQCNTDISIQPKQHQTQGPMRAKRSTYRVRCIPCMEDLAVSEAVPGSGGIHSEDAKVLLVLLSFLSTSDKIPLDLLFRGAAPRKRWTAQGEIKGVDAIHTGLVLELCSLLSDMPRLGNSFHELDLSSAVFKNNNQTYTLDEVITSCTRKRLSAEDLSFWRYQAIIIIYRAVP